MSNIPRVYRSTDPGAPVLNGQPGSFASVLDAVLVDGYGSGSGLKEPLGWIRAFTGPNRRAFRNDPSLYSGQYLRVDDGNAQYALIDGYEAMSDVDTGSQRFESVSAWWSKSSQANSTPREWAIVGTAQCIYLSLGHNTDGRGFIWFAGDYHSLVPGDLGRFAYSRSASQSYGASTGLFTPSLDYGLRVARPANGTPGGGHKLTHRVLLSNAASYGNSGFPYPLPTTNGIFLCRAMLNENTYSTGGIPRGVMPGVWAPDQNVSSLYTDRSVYSGFLDLPPGTELFALKNTNGNASTGPMAFLDITNPW